MPKAVGLRILEARDDVLAEEKVRKAPDSQTQNVARKKLADISNQPQNRKPLIQEKSQSIETATKEYIHKLQKENMTLVKMLAQRNKIIEHNGIELDRVRVNLLKMQEQNKELAVTNSQMLAEINSDKGRLNILQHELGCVTGLVRARRLNVEKRATTQPLEDVDAELIKSREEMESSKEDIDDEKPRETISSLQTEGVCSSKQVEYMDKAAENKRLILRRQSARFNVAEAKHTDDSSETKDTLASASQLAEDSFQEQVSASESALAKDEANNTKASTSCVVRPSRAAKKKVQSYKEMPLKGKMRRPD